MLISYRVGAEEQDKADDLVEDGLHLLVTSLADGRQRHQACMAVLPVSWGMENKTVIQRMSHRSVQFNELYLHDVYKAETQT